MSSTHRVFGLDELVRNIAHRADATTQGSASLLALACCCKSLEGPVMDVLWRRQTILPTILETLPADSWSVTNDVFVRKKLDFPPASWALPDFQSLSRNLSRDEWERFRRYTARVTALGVPKTYPWLVIPLYRFQPWISTETIQIFWMESQRGGLWPRVRSLECYIDWDIVPFISLFLTPTIADLCLSFPRNSNPLLQPALSLLSHTCRQLQSLKVCVDTSGSPSGDEMGRLISASGNTLRSIDIQPSTPPETFPAIFNLPLLRSLKLDDPRFPDLVPSEILSPLEDVSLMRSHLPSLAQFLRRLSTKELATVLISARETIQLHASLNSLTQAATTIKHLSIFPVTALDRSSITFLRTFASLTSLTLGCVCGVPGGEGLACSLQPTDQDLLDLGGALPRIHTLDLGLQCRKPCRATLKSLIGLSRICGSLERLLIKVDFASAVDGSGQQNHSNTSLGANNPRTQRGRSKLRVLSLGRSLLPDIPRCEWIVALALFTIFPSINSLTPSVTWEGVWSDILVCRRIFHAIEAEGKSLSTRPVVPMLMCLIQTRPQFYRPVRGSRLS